MSTASISSSIFASHSASPFNPPSAEPRITGTSSPGKSYFDNSSRTSISTRSISSGSSTASHLFRNTTKLRNANLARQQNVLLGLRHRTIGRRNHQNAAIHLRRAGDHVLDVVGVARAIDVRIVPVLGLVLDVRGRDRDAALPLFRSIINGVKADGT